MCWLPGDFFYFFYFHERYILQCTPRCLYLLGTLCPSYIKILTNNVELYTVSGVRLQNCQLGSRPPFVNSSHDLHSHPPSTNSNQDLHTPPQKTTFHQIQPRSRLVLMEGGRLWRSWLKLMEGGRLWRSWLELLEDGPLWRSWL
jgi:hypothetical protein